MCMMSGTWVGFGEISPATSPSCMKLVNFDVFFQSFGKSKAKCGLNGEFCGTLVKFCWIPTMTPLKITVLL